MRDRPDDAGASNASSVVIGPVEAGSFRLIALEANLWDQVGSRALRRTDARELLRFRLDRRGEACTVLVITSEAPLVFEL